MTFSELADWLDSQEETEYREKQLGKAVLSVEKGHETDILIDQG